MTQNHPEPIVTPHHEPESISEHIAYAFVKFLRFFADLFFAQRYGHRAVILETVAGVPGMVGAMLQHLKSLRRCQDDDGWIKTLLDEAENERMHLMTFIEIAHPNRFERFLIIVTQVCFFSAYFILYILSPKTAHRVVGYLEEEAVVSYTYYIQEVEAGQIENIPVPQIAIDYWQLAPDARLKELLYVVRADEARHRDTNHDFANLIARK